MAQPDFLTMITISDLWLCLIQWRRMFGWLRCARTTREHHICSFVDSNYQESFTFVWRSVLLYFYLEIFSSKLLDRSLKFRLLLYFFAINTLLYSIFTFHHLELFSSLFFCNFRLLVGAPLGQNLQPMTNRSGALFKCPITQNTNDCTQVITDGRRCKS